MKTFLFKIALFTFIISVFITLILNFYGGYIDPFYVKFTTPKQHSLIIGDSKSYQGIQPSVINNELKNKFDLPMFNYSFTIAQCAYGEGLLKSIENKLDTNTKNGLFILTVNPWILAEREQDDFENGHFFEDDLPPQNMTFASMKPNFEYFFKNFNYFHFKAIFRKNTKINEDGWIEELKEEKDIKTLNSVKKNWLQAYIAFGKKWKKSDYRLHKLDKIIRFLKKHGTVVIVRMPSSEEVIVIENQFWKNFDGNMLYLANKNQVHYFNYMKDNTQFQTYDGVHLDKIQGALFTKALCDSIQFKK